MPQSLEIVPLRTSERTLFKKCRLAWKWSYVDCLKPLRESSALGYGSLAHKVLELRYPKGRKRGPRPDILAKQVYKDYLSEGGQEFTVKIGDTAHDAGEFLVHMFENYYEEYGDDERYAVIAPEQTFAVDVFHPATNKYLFTQVGTIDGVWRDLDTGLVIFVEHKTGANLEPFGAPIYLDEQQATYWAFGPMWLEHTGVLKPGQEIDHVLYNRLRKGLRDDRPINPEGKRLNKPTKDILVAAAEDAGLEFRRGIKVTDLVTLLEDYGVNTTLLGAVSQSQPVPLFKREPVYRTAQERARTLARIRAEFREMKLARAGKLATYKTPDRHCGFCAFRDACELHEAGEDYKALFETQFNIWDPYSDHMEDQEDG
jgi:hypothetical protein